MIRTPAFFIGCRYLLSRKGNRFISFTSLISMAGLILGVLALIIVLSVFNGSQGIMRDRTLITVPHANITATASFQDWDQVRELLLAQPGIEGVAPYLSAEAMISQRGRHHVVPIKAIDPALEETVSSLSGHLQRGSLASLQAGQRQILLGRSLASNLQLNLGDSVNLILPGMSDGGRAIDLNMHRFTVAGIFDVQFSIGANLAYIHLADGAAILGLERPEQALELRLRVDNIHAAEERLQTAMTVLNTHFPQQMFSGSHWAKTEASLFNALRLEKVMTSFMLLMIVAIGAFNIISTLVMVVSDKQADIAILRTMGAGERTIMAIFMVQGFLVGILGTGIGALAGLLVVFNFDLVSGLLNLFTQPADMYIITSLPAELLWSDVGFICSAALLISFLATLYPAWKASRIHPAEILRYE